MNLKRKYENNSCTHGILTIPAYHFRCVTLELRDGDDLTYKHDCRIPEGSYILVRGFAQYWPSFPVFKKKVIDAVMHEACGMRLKVARDDAVVMRHAYGRLLALAGV